MALTVVTLETQDRIGTLTLNRPEKLNALNPSLIAEFAEAIDTVAADPGLRSERRWTVRASHYR